MNYRSEDLIKSLNLRLGQHIFLETGDIKHQMNPLLGAPDMAVPARVVEYLTHEMGILKYVITFIFIYSSIALYFHQVGTRLQGLGPVPH